jgi:hypothetical protein
MSITVRSADHTTDRHITETSPSETHNTTAKWGTNRAAPLGGFPLLVRAGMKLAPACPFDVASRLGSIETVLIVFVNAVVGNVLTAPYVSASPGTSARKTSANPGAGTLMSQVLSDLQVTV